MRQLISLLLFILFCIPFPAFAAETKPKDHLSWQLRDLYYHDANGTVVQLELAPELSVKFTREMPSEEKTALFAEFSPIAEKEQPGDSSRILLSFHESVTPANLLDAANKIAASGNAETSPVFFVNNIKAVIEGIVIEPKIVLTPNRLEARMRKYGEFTLRQAIGENGAWVFLIDEIKPPLNLLVLTNLISKDDWVQRAYPRFKFLHDPIVASIHVEPVSGTIGETRKVTLMIRTFDPSITLSTDRLPEFGGGLFRPIQGDPSSPSSIRHVPGYLFELVGDPVRHPEKQEKRSRVYMTSWQFKQYAIGEWTIHPLTVPYAKNGVDQEIKSSGFTLVVNSQIGNLKITDMPVSYPLVHSSEKPVASPDVILPPVPSYWFDRWMSRADVVARYAGFAGLFLGLLLVGGIVVPATRVLRRNRKKASDRRERFRHIASTLQEAHRSRSYTKYDEALSLMLVELSPALSSHPTWEDIKDTGDISNALGIEVMTLLETVFSTLNQRYASNFMLRAEDIEGLDESIRTIFDTVKQISATRKETQ